MTHENVFSIAIWLSSCLSFLCFLRETTSWYLVHTSALKNIWHQMLPTDELEPSKPKRGQALGSGWFLKGHSKWAPSAGPPSKQLLAHLEESSLFKSQDAGWILKLCSLAAPLVWTRRNLPENQECNCRVRSTGWEVQQPSSKPAPSRTQGKLGEAETHLSAASIFSVVFSVPLQWIKIIPNALGKKHHSVPPAARPFTQPCLLPRLPAPLSGMRISLHLLQSRWAADPHLGSVIPVHHLQVPGTGQQHQL